MRGQACCPHQWGSSARRCRLWASAAGMEPEALPAPPCGSRRRPHQARSGKRHRWGSPRARKAFGFTACPLLAPCFGKCVPLMENWQKEEDETLPVSDGDSRASQVSSMWKLMEGGCSWSWLSSAELILYWQPSLEYNRWMDKLL